MLRPETVMPHRSDADGLTAAEGMAPRGRLDSIDLVRGLVMVVMALDHMKGNFSNSHFDATDLTKTTTAYYLTRWVTHFCGPTFVFLAGTGAFLHGSRGRTKPQMARFLLSRGLWLVFLELTVVRFSWFLDLTFPIIIGQVIWAIGWSMIFLAGMVFLPVGFVTAFGVAMIVLHNLFDGVTSGDWGRFGWLWKILHTGEGIQVLPGYVFAPMYPLIPWIGVMAAGYGFGEFMLLERRRRRSVLLGLGVALTVLFVALRFSNLYGDKVASEPGRAGPWSMQEMPLFTAFSFVNCQKYPPSLCFLLMTLGPTIIMLAYVDRDAGPAGKVLVLFGRVPLFFYLLHFYLIKGLAILFALIRYGRADWLIGANRPDAPVDNGYELWLVYLVWLGVVLILFPLCWWFAGVKRRTQSVWLSYL